MPSLPDPAELETSLWRDLLDRWFPACLDPEGGYRQNFDANFRPTGDRTKGLVFQSRMVWVCATMAGERPEFAEYARHGMRFLLDRMRLGDAFAWSVDADGPTTDEVHAYGLSFLVYGLAAVARHLGDPEAYEGATRAVAYLERVHRDAEHGGFFEASVEGRVKRTGGEKGDTIGTPYGQKSQNTHLHLMEAYAELLRAAPDERVRDGLAELVGVLSTRLFAAPGHLTLFTHADWTPASTAVSYGHDIEAAHLLLDAEDELRNFDLWTNRDRGATGEKESAVMRHARVLADRTLAAGWDSEDGGVFNMGDAHGPTDRSKVWWVQAEALLGFATLWKRCGDARYGGALAETWAFIQRSQIDRANGGWHEWAGRPETPKGHAWKAAYHDGRALLFAARLLREEFYGTRV